MAKLETEPDDLDDFGFYYDFGYIMTTCGLAVLSNFALLPRAGGLDSQDWFWLQDLFTYLKGLSYAKWQARPVPDSKDDQPTYDTHIPVMRFPSG